MDPSVAWRLFILVILLFFSAFFSSAETSFTTVNKLRIRSLAEEGSKRAVKAGFLIDDPSKMLSTILIGNNIVNIAASSLTTALVLELFGNAAVSIAAGVLTLIILIFGEITPKTFATIHAEKIVLLYTPFLSFLIIIFTPLTYIISKLTGGLLFILRIDPDSKTPSITENELLTIVDASHEEGVIESEERQMIANVVDFGDALAKDVMVPRIDMKFASDDMSFSELSQTFREEQYSRMPVYSGNRDNIIGIIHLKDVFLNYTGETPFDIKKYIRPASFTYEFKKTSELMAEMRNEHISIVIVLDEYGATSGLITLEDLLEEIVGEIRDEYDSDEVDVIRKISDNEYEADGSAKLDEINEALGLSLQSDDYDSIAGHVIRLLNHLPSVGEQIQERNIIFTVIAATKNRIDKVRIVLLPEEAETD